MIAFHYSRLYRPILVALLILAASLIIPYPAADTNLAAAQDSADPELAAQIEALALHVHLLNRRTTDYTTWIGGDLGDAVQYKPTWTPGDAFTDWELPGLRASDAAVTADDLTRPTLLNVWASWCAPCIQEFPHLTETALNPADHAFDVLFVNAWEASTDDALAFLADFPPDIHVLSDPDGAAIIDRIGAPGIPVSMLLGADGTVWAIHLGTLTRAHAALFEMIAQHPGIGQFDAADYADVEPLAQIAPVDPATAIPISAGDIVKGTITDEAVQQAYTFVGTAGERITIQMSIVFRIAASGKPDSYVEPYVVLLAADGTRLTESRGYFYENYASIESFKLPEDGTYTIVATRFLEADGLSAGPYELFVDVE